MKSKVYQGTVLSGLLIGVMGLALAASAATEEHFGMFEMLEGQGVPLCEACFKALETAPSDLTGCERPYDPGFGLSSPAWTKLEPLKNLALLKKVMLLVQPAPQGIAGTIYDAGNFEQEIKNQMRHGGVGLSLVKIDIDNDGRKEPVLKLRKGACIAHSDALHVQYQPLVVLRDDHATIDHGKTDLVMQNPRKRREVPVGDADNRIYDVFRYEGQVYFDKWEWDDYNSGGENLFIYQAVGKGVTPLCKYRYHRRYQSQTPGGKP